MVLNHRRDWQRVWIVGSVLWVVVAASILGSGAGGFQWPGNGTHVPEHFTLETVPSGWIGALYCGERLDLDEVEHEQRCYRWALGAAIAQALAVLLSVPLVTLIVYRVCRWVVAGFRDAT